jgi:hypothetical protein
MYSAAGDVKGVGQVWRKFLTGGGLPSRRIEGRAGLRL